MGQGRCRPVEIGSGFVRSPRPSSSPKAARRNEPHTLRLGTSYANVVVAAQRWQRLSGFSLPRARRGKIGPVEIRHVTPRMQAVVAAYRAEGVTLRQVGAQIGKTAEWVRLQLNTYEDLTGERIARKPRGKRGRD